MMKYDLFMFNKAFSSFDTSLIVIFVVLFIASFITSLIGLLREAQNKTFPLMALSVHIFIMIIVVLIVSEPYLLQKKIEDCVVTNYGIFHIPIEKERDGKNYFKYEKRKLIENTHKIPAKLGSSFGFHFILSGQPDEGEVKLMKIIQYPAQGINDGVSITKRDTSFISVTLNKMRYTSFNFEYEYELVCGHWEWELWYKAEQLLEQGFDIYTD